MSLFPFIHNYLTSRWGYRHLVDWHILWYHNGTLIFRWHLTHICLGSVFLDFGEGFREYLISVVLIKFCLLKLKKLRLFSSSNQGSKNPLVYFNLSGISLGSVFFWTWWRIYWPLDFTCLDGVLFLKVKHIFTYIVISNLCIVLQFSFFCPFCRHSNQWSH